MKKFLMVLMVFIITIILCACSNQNKSDEPIQEEEYRKVDERYTYNWTIGVATEKEDDNLGTLLISTDKEIPLKFTFGFSGQGDADKKSEAQIKMYYDYKPVSFKLNGTDGFDYTYNFEMENHKKYTSELYLNSKEIVQDNTIHKLFITITTGNEKYAKDLEFSNSAYGISTIYDLVHSREYADEVYAKTQDFTTNNTFQKVTDKQYFPHELSVNQDNNLSIEKGLATNLPNYNAHNNKIDFNAYITSLNKEDDFLVMINLNFDIFTSMYIPAGESVGTYAGDLSFQLKSNENLNEYTAYTIVNPFEKITDIGNQFTKASNRFTITNDQ